VQDPAHKEEVMRPLAGRDPLPADPERKRKRHCGPRGGHVKEGVFPRSVSGTLSGRDLGQTVFNGRAFGSRTLFEIGGEVRRLGPRQRGPWARLAFGPRHSNKTNNETIHSKQTSREGGM